MKTKFFTLFFVLISLLTFAQVETLSLTGVSSGSEFFYCETTTNSAIVYKPDGTGLCAWYPNGNPPSIQQDSIIITQTSPSFWEFTDGSTSILFYVYFVSIAPSESWVSTDTLKCTEGSLLLDAQTNHQSDFSYEWNTGATSRFLTVNTAGNYLVTVTGVCGVANDAIQVINHPIPQPNLGPDMTNVCDWDHKVLDPGSFTSYNWSTGESTPTITISQTGEYSVIVTDVNGCLGYDTINIEYYVNPGVEIFMVTIDTINGNNKIVWETDIPDFQNHYVKIFRNGVTNDMNLIESVPYIQGTYTDNVNSFQRTWRYAITSNDNCGNNSTMSPYHESMKISLLGMVGNGVQVSWTPYIIEGAKSVSTYRIYSVGGFGSAWSATEIDAVPGTQTTYDLPASNDSLYVVGAEIQGAKNTSSLALSVIQNPIMTNIQNIELEDVKFDLYPNPSSGLVSINGTGLLQVSNSIGKIILYQNVTGIVNLNLKSGIYYVIFTDQHNTTTTQKVIIQ